jgi:molecular chaperone GrpE
MQEGERAQTQPGPQPQTDAAAPAGLESASVSEVEAELQAALAKANENYERYVRAVADGENIRRRAQEDIAKAHKYGVESFARHLVPVVASLDQSLAALATGADPAALREGIELTRKQLLSAFEKGQITEINPAVGEKQDPRRHDAVAAVPAADIAPGHIVSVLQRGWLIADRVLQPAMVTVAQARTEG